MAQETGSQLGFRLGMAKIPYGLTMEPCEAGRKLQSRGGIQPRKHMYNLIELIGSHTWTLWFIAWWKVIVILRILQEVYGRLRKHDPRVIGWHGHHRVDDPDVDTVVHALLEFINGRLIEDSVVLPVLPLILVQDMAEHSGRDCKSSKRMESQGFLGLGDKLRPVCRNIFYVRGDVDVEAIALEDRLEKIEKPKQ
jgi:hypothetical protein